MPFLKKSLYLCSPMCSLESFKIDLKGLKTDVTVFEYDLDDAFFRAVDTSEVSRGQVHVLLTIHKIGTSFSLDIHCEGIVTVPCNRCLDDMELPVTADHQLVARFGVVGSDEDDQLTVDERDGVLDVSWIIYEQVALAIPIQHVHPEGTCDASMIRMLEDYSTDRDNNEAEVASSEDPRWAKLKDLINNL